MREELYLKLKEIISTMPDDELDKLIDFLLSLKAPHNQ